MNEIKNHLYSVHLLSGSVRMTESEIVRDLGPDAFESEFVEHSSWCACVVVLDEPPF